MTNDGNYEIDFEKTAKTLADMSKIMKKRKGSENKIHRELENLCSIAAFCIGRDNDRVTHYALSYQVLRAYQKIKEPKANRMDFENRFKVYRYEHIFPEDFEKSVWEVHFGMDTLASYQNYVIKVATDCDLLLVHHQAQLFLVLNDLYNLKVDIHAAIQIM